MKLAVAELVQIYEQNFPELDLIRHRFNEMWNMSDTFWFVVDDLMYYEL